MSFFLGYIYFINNNINMSDYFNKLDSFQKNVILDNSKNLLVVAGAGSGKTFTIVSKIKYLIEQRNVNPEDVLCISFTNEAVNSLVNKIQNVNVNVFTFHKLSLNILSKANISYNIVPPNLLEYIVDEFFATFAFNNNFLLRNILIYFKIRINKTTNLIEKYNSFIREHYLEMLSFKKLLIKFIMLFKSMGYKYSYFLKILNKVYKKRDIAFILIVINIYLIYEDELKSIKCIDFDDMIIYAKELIMNDKIMLQYKYIFVDEFQDTSYIRYLLLKAIADKTNANVICVGDDFQSIYRFSGCDLNIFVNFSKYFNDSKILKLENTYRNSKQLIYVAGKFIMKNKKQIRKNMISKITVDKPIVIYYYKDLKSDFEYLIRYIYGKILIISRNNADIKNVLNNNFILKKDEIIYINDKNITLKFLTVHRSKGLESDNIIVLNVVNELTGFPNKIEDDRILRFVSNKCELYDEERRLFYVALTRTKNRVYLLTQKGRESVFIKEIKAKYKKYIIEIKK